MDEVTLVVVALVGEEGEEVYLFMSLSSFNKLTSLGQDEDEYKYGDKDEDRDEDVAAAAAPSVVGS